MDIEIAELAGYLVHKLDHANASRRILVGIAGIPASGKSTLAHLLTERINHILDGRQPPGKSDDQRSLPPTTRPQAILVGLDGWHYSRAQLDLFPDPKLAHDRRGSHWTFDGHAYVEFAHKLRVETEKDIVVTAPSFDHALKDPTADTVVIHPHHRIVIIEGLYVFLAIEPWNKAGMILDERWFIEVNAEEAKKRLVGRHVLTGIAKDALEADWRANENDIPNGHFIVANMLEPTRVIQSTDDPKYQLSRAEDKIQL